MFPETIETDSLILRRLCRDTVDPFVLYDRFGVGAEGVRDVFEHLPQKPFVTLAEAREWLVDAEAEWDDGDVAQYAVSPSDDPLAGFAALSVVWGRRTGRPGDILAGPFWGNGYAGECALALTDLALDRLDLDLVAVGYETGNDRSKRAVESFVERVGGGGRGQYDGVLRNWTPLGDEIRDHHRYTVTQEQYRRSGTGDTGAESDG